MSVPGPKFLASLDEIERLPRWRKWWDEQPPLRQSWIAGRMAMAVQDVGSLVEMLNGGRENYSSDAVNGGAVAQPWDEIDSPAGPQMRHKQFS